MNTVIKTRSGEKYSCIATDKLTVAKDYPLCRSTEKQAHRLYNKKFRNIPIMMHTIEK